MSTRTKVWEGNREMARLLVPVGELKPHPSNPRRGDIGVLQESLRRFGQQRPVLCLPDGTLVAGHHVYYAAVAEGWTHVAVVRSDLTGDEVNAYLAADNRTAELGGYDDSLLLDLLRPLPDLTGTGYNADDVNDLLAASLRQPGAAPDPAASGGIGRDIVEVVLLYSVEQRDQFQAWVEAFMRREEIDSLSKAVHEAMRRAAEMTA